MENMKTIWNLPLVQEISLTNIVEERASIIVSSDPAWEIVKEKLKFLYKAESLLLVKEATTSHWYRLMQERKGNTAEVVFAVGGGLAVDAGKYIAKGLGLPLVCIPTALSVDAFFTAASGIREGGCVRYIETKVPDTVLLDYQFIAQAPATIRAAGITDVMSIATGAWDWKFAHEQGKNPAGMDFIPWVYNNAQSILSGALDCAEAAGRGDKDGLKALYDCLAMEVQLCNQVGHSRPEEGSEHYFAYAVENEMGHGLPHGDLVGPGIMIMSKLQGQDTGPLEAALRACNIPLDRIPPEVVNRTLAELPAYCEKHELAFGLAHTLGKQ
jgi:glycerol-1-phosphate dehydrogenase [NAD(P)+]